MKTEVESMGKQDDPPLPDTELKTEQAKIQTKGQINRKMKKIKDVQTYMKGDSEEPLTTKNKLRLSLDGTPKEAQKAFSRYSKEVKSWYYSKGRRVNASTIFGRDKEMYSTSENGTLEIEVTHGADCVTFVINASHGWMDGYRVDDAEFELKPDDGKKSCMTNPKKKTLSFKGNHYNISGGNPGGVEIGLYKFRKALRSIIEKGENPDPEDIGRFVLLLCEAPKLKPVLDRICKSFVDPGTSRLDKNAPWMNDFIRNWSDFSEEIILHIHYVGQGLPPPPLKPMDKVPWMNSIEKYAANIRILHLSADKHGLFSHSKTDAEEKKLQERKDRNKKKNEGESSGKKLKSGHTHGFVSHKTELRAYDSVRKRSMSTGHKTEVIPNGGCHVKPVQGMPSASSTEIMQDEGVMRLKESQTLSQFMPSRNSYKLISEGVIKTMHQFEMEGNSITKSYMTFNQAKIVQTQGLTFILKVQTLSKPRWVCNNMKTPMGPLSSAISTGKNVEVTETTQGFKSKVSFITKSYTAINQTMMLHHKGTTLRSHRNQKISHTKWSNNYMPVPMQPVGNFIGSKMKPNKIIKQIEGVPHWLGPPFFQNAAFSRRTGILGRAVRLLVGLKNRPR